MADTKIVEFYRARGHCAENMIRELKNGFDLKHFPCQKLAANKAYGLIAAFAHNVVRFLSFVENPKKQHFSKLIPQRRTGWKMFSFSVLVDWASPSACSGFHFPFFKTTPRGGAFIFIPNLHKRTGPGLTTLFGWPPAKAFKKVSTAELLAKSKKNAQISATADR